MMLVLSRKAGERIWISDTVEVTVLEIQGNRVKLGFAAPPNVAIHRQEIYQKRILAGQCEVDACARSVAHVPA